MPLRRVRDHCQQVRQLIDNSKYCIHNMAHHSHFSEAHGGLMLSLDLTKAFDNVCRSRLFEALHQLQVDTNLVQMFGTDLFRYLLVVSAPGAHTIHLDKTRYTTRL